MKLPISLDVTIQVEYAICTKDGEVLLAQGMCPNAHLSKKNKEFKTPKKFMLIEGNTKLGSVSFLHTRVVSSVQSKNFQAAVELYVSSKLSTGADISSQYFIIDKFDEDGEARSQEDLFSEIENMFFNKNMKNLPIPIEDDWKEFFWSFVKDGLVELEYYGENIPKRGYHLNIPSIETLGSSIRLSQMSFEFKRYHRRVPSLNALLYISDAKGFNPKLWSEFVNKEIGGIDNFKELSFDHQVAIAQGFEVFGGISEVFTRRQVIHTSSTVSLNRMMRVTTDKSKKELWKRILGSGIKHFKDNGMFSRFIDNFEMLLDTKLEAMKNGSWSSIEEELMAIKYQDIDPALNQIQDSVSEYYMRQIPSLVNVCSDSGVSERAFKEYQNEYIDGVELALQKPRCFPLFDMKVGKLNVEVIDTIDPTSLIVGRATNCCQHFGSVGGACVRYMLKNPDTSGILAIKESGKIIAQSFFWLQESSVAGEYIMVFDSIEHLGSLRDSVRNCYKEAVTHIAKKYALQFSIRSINVGAGWGGCTKLGDLKSSEAKGPNKATIPNGLSYTDANKQYVIASINLHQEVTPDGSKFVKGWDS